MNEKAKEIKYDAYIAEFKKHYIRTIIAFVFVCIGAVVLIFVPMHKPDSGTYDFINAVNAEERDGDLYIHEDDVLRAFHVVSEYEEEYSEAFEGMPEEFEELLESDLFSPFNIALWSGVEAALGKDLSSSQREDFIDCYQKYGQTVNIIDWMNLESPSNGRLAAGFSMTIVFVPISVIMSVLLCAVKVILTAIHFKQKIRGWVDDIYNGNALTEKTPFSSRISNNCSGAALGLFIVEVVVLYFLVIYYEVLGASVMSFCIPMLIFLLVFQFPLSSVFNEEARCKKTVEWVVADITITHGTLKQRLIGLEEKAKQEKAAKEIEQTE